MQDDWIKRLIHFVCGAIPGAFLGVLVLGRAGLRRDVPVDDMSMHLVWYALIGALVVGLLCAFYLDQFWAWLQDR